MRKLTFEELTSRRMTLDSIRAAERFPFAIILQDVRSLYNVGSIFRTADAFRANMLILTGFTPSPPRKEISKTALDAEASVPWKYYRSTLEAIGEMRQNGWKIYAVEVAHESRGIPSLSQQDFPAVFVLGNELSGVTDDIMAECDGAFEISMHGVKHSLNVAVAAGIIMYQAATICTS
ncbi:MAG: RNA methyltransferase [Ignavibacteria bacterium]|nr:RNA methyltransferase [Ignavibacteria bacterium]